MPSLQGPAAGVACEPWLVVTSESGAVSTDDIARVLNNGYGQNL
jgi:hypothetical protein